MKFLIFDGKIVTTEEVDMELLCIEESFRLSQKVWFGFGGIPLFFENMEVMASQANSLQLPFPKEFKNKRELLRLTKRMLNKNKFYRSGFVYFQLFNNSSFEDHTLVTCRSLPEPNFLFPPDGLLLCFSDQKKPAQNEFNRYSFFNKTLWDVALSKLYDTHFHNTVILNEKNMVCECAYANIFMIKGNDFITPSLSSGCFEDTIRSLVLNAAGSLGKKIIETKAVHKNDLLKMDEIFIAGEQAGVQWILGIEHKRFVHQFSINVYNKLNSILKRKVN